MTWSCKATANKRKRNVITESSDHSVAMPKATASDMRSEMCLFLLHPPHGSGQALFYCINTDQVVTRATFVPIEMTDTIFNDAEWTARQEEVEEPAPVSVEHGARPPAIIQSSARARSQSLPLTRVLH